MKRKLVSGIMFILLLTSVLTFAFNVQPVKSDWTWTETIYIRADGSVDPIDAPILSADKIIYTLTDNIAGVSSWSTAIVVERDNIVVDGAGYTVQGTESGAHAQVGIYLNGRSNVTIKNIQIKEFSYGIWLVSSSNNIISGNNIKNNWIGIKLEHSSSNSIVGNNIKENSRGIYLKSSSNNVFRNNTMVGNSRNFEVYGSTLSHFINDVDVSNTVDGKPIYYWVNRQNMEVPLDAGYVALINSTNITVKGLELKNNAQGILLAYTINSQITNNNITNNYYGIYLWSSDYNTVSGNNITNNDMYGIHLPYSSNYNRIIGNNITNNVWAGIYLLSSSNNVVSGNNITKNNNDGIELHYSSNNSFSGNNITSNFLHGIYFDSSSNNTVSGNNITKNINYGIELHCSSNNSFSGNNITSKFYGIHLVVSSSNIIVGNNITENNIYGILLKNSSNNTLRSNSIVDNKYNFGVWGWTLSHFVNDVDVSNTVDGKPVYYLINQKSLVINSSTYPNVGYLALVNSTNITVEGLELKNNGQGILLAYSTNTSIRQNNITANKYQGIWLWCSSNNSISGNNIKNNYLHGIYFDSSSNNIISGNNITNNKYGIELYSLYPLYFSSNNSISGNNITNNGCGIVLSYSSNNKFYHNNFIDNTWRVYCEPGYANVWDDGYPSGGNYRSDYVGVDVNSGSGQDLLGSDGISDTPYIIDANNQDHYPLMKPWSPRVESVIIINAEPKTVTVGSDIAVSGAIMPVRANVNVTIYYRFVGELIWTPIATVKTNARGGYSYVWKTTQIGTYEVKAIWLGDENTLPAESAILTVNVEILGDVNGDNKVNIKDIAQAALSFGSYPSHPRWNIQADINQDGKVDIRDLALIAKNFGKKYP